MTSTQPAQQWKPPPPQQWVPPQWREKKKVERTKCNNALFRLLLSTAAATFFACCQEVGGQSPISFVVGMLHIEQSIHCYSKFGNDFRTTAPPHIIA